MHSDYDIKVAEYVLFDISFLPPKKSSRYVLFLHETKALLLFVILLNAYHELLSNLYLHVTYSKEDAHKSMIYSYQHGFSGFAALLTSSQANKISGTK